MLQNGLSNVFHFVCSTDYIFIWKLEIIRFCGINLLRKLQGIFPKINIKLGKWRMRTFLLGRKPFIKRDQLNEMWLLRNTLAYRGIKCLNRFATSFDFTGCDVLQGVWYANYVCASMFRISKNIFLLERFHWYYRLYALMLLLIGIVLTKLNTALQFRKKLRLVRLSDMSVYTVINM